MAENGSYWQHFWERRLGRRRLLYGAALGGAGLAAGAVVGCAEEQKSGSEPSAAAPAAQQPKRGGIIRTYHHVDPPSFDIYINYGLHSVVINSFVYSKLARLSTGPNISPLDTVMTLDLAEKLEQPDPLTHVIQLRENVVWHDRPPLNGRPLTVQDIVYNWQLYSSKHTNRERIVPYVESVTATDQRTKRFKMKRPLAPFLYYIGHPSDLFIYPPELKERDATRETMVGIGPWALEGYDVGSAIKFVRNPKYYRPFLPYADDITVSIIRDPSTVIANLRTGALDVTLGSPISIPLADVPSLKQALRGAKWIEVPFPAVSTISMDISDPKFKDERVRQAMSLAIDREGLLQLLGGGAAYGSPLPPIAFWWLDPKQDAELRKYYVRDVPRARQLMSAAGYADGISGIKYKFDSAAPDQRQRAELVAANRREIGIVVELDPLPTAQAFATVFVGRHAGAMGDAAGTFTRDPDEGFTLVFTNNPRSPIAGKQLLAQDRQLLDLLEKQRFELDRQRRKAIVDDLQRYLSQKMYATPKETANQAHVAQARVKNMHWVRTLDPGIQFDEVWLEG